MRCITLIVAAVLATMSCGRDLPTPPSDLVEVTGIYSGGFEASFLGPCGADETWWVQPTSPFWDRYVELGLPAYGNAFVRMTGRVSAPGHYGHMGLASREFAAAEVLEIRAATAQDCLQK